MNLGGIIAGAVGGGAQAVGQMADSNLRAQAEDERAARERQEKMQDAQTQRAWRKEDAAWEMDQKLSRIGAETKAKTQAGIESQGMLNAEREKIRGGLIGSEIDKAIPPHIVEQSKNWSPEARAQLATDQEAVRSRAASDPNVGRDVGLAMGEMTQKDVMANDVAQERARNQQLRDQMRADQESMKEEGRNSRADARIEALISRGGKDGDVNEKLNTTISTHRQIIEANERRLEDMLWARKNPDQAKQLADDILASREMIRAATKAQQNRMGVDSTSSGSPQKNTDTPEVLGERVRIIRNEYDAAVQSGNKDVAVSTARELKRLGADIQSPSTSKATSGSMTRISSKAEYDKLPSGTKFTAPDGSTRIKP